MTERVAMAALPSRFGDFRAIAFSGEPGEGEPLALVRGTVAGRSLVPVRVHSECLTGDVLGSLRCDCGQQRNAALRALGRLPYGVFLYLRQEGRGIGLANKIRAYALQDLGHDTFTANRMLGFGEDDRDYAVAARILAALAVESIRLMTNNPLKLRGLREHGVRVVDRIPLIVPPNRHNEVYLAAKQQHAGHWLSPAPATDSNPSAGASSRSLPCRSSLES
jgi:GTP cyclohydrolase II